MKGRAGSPYAITDYYDIDPDLAVDVKQRMKEFEALVARTHEAGLKVIIDFVPNHVARQYHSICKPKKVQDLGETDNTAHGFDPQNNFYYCPGQRFTPYFDLYQGATEPYLEEPAKATGNDHFDNAPGRTDWYETVKLNYGVDYYAGKIGHFDPIPDTWQKMTDILLFWAKKGIDGFRCDMAEMVPAEFWQYATTIVKKNVVSFADMLLPMPSPMLGNRPTTSATTCSTSSRITTNSALPAISLQPVPRRVCQESLHAVCWPGVWRTRHGS